jgi:hypothetical protein
MMKIRDVIAKLQKIADEHGDLDFCVEATELDSDGKIRETAIGNDLVLLEVVEDSLGNYCRLVAKT